MTRKTAARRRRERRLRIIAWVVLISLAAFAISRFLQLPGWGQAVIVVGLLLLGLLWFLLSRRREIAEEMDRIRDAE
jgi:LPXTG-motif cell wall-anchored protein